MRRVSIVITLWVISAGLAGCLGGWGFAHDQPLIGPYRLVAVDVREDMIVCRGLASGDCVGDGLPGATVFAAGGNERYLVIARHPREFPQPADRTVTEYYFAERSADEGQPGARPTVHGPFDRTAFAAQRRRLGLPSFTVLFEDLK